MSDQTHPNPTEPTTDEVAAAIRYRMVRVMTVEFVLLMGVAAIQGFWPDGGPGRGVALVFLVVERSPRARGDGVDGQADPP